MKDGHGQVETFYEKALALERGGEFDKAYELLSSCLSPEDDCPAEIAFHCGWCLENGGNPDRERAIGFYERAAAKTADDSLKSSSLYRAGWLLVQEKDYAGAAEAFKQTVALAEGSHLNNALRYPALYWYAVSIECLGRYLEAADCYDRLKVLAPDLSPESSYRKVICYCQVGNYSAAMEECGLFPRQCPPGYDPVRFAELLALMTKEEGQISSCLSEDQHQVCTVLTQGSKAEAGSGSE